MPDATGHADLRALRAATLSPAGEVVPATSLTIGALTWPAAHAHRIVHAWRAWTAAVPGATSLVRLARPPRGAATVAVEVTLTAGPALVAPLRALEPELDTVRDGPPAALCPGVRLVPPGMTPLTVQRRLAALPAAAADAFATAAGPDARAELLAAELHHRGGVYVLAAAGAAPDADGAERVHRSLAALSRALGPWSTA